MILSIGELGNYDFASTHRWSVVLTDIGLPSRNGKYIPATNVDELIYGLTSRDIKLGPASFKIMEGLTTPAVSVNYIDQDDYLIFKQLQEWAKSIFNNGRWDYSKTKTLTVIKYKKNGEVDHSTSYEVLLDDTIKYLGESSPGLMSNVMVFVIIDIIK